MTISILFGNRIKSIRHQQGLTQALLAEKSGLSDSYIGELERGEKGVTLETISIIARSFGIPVYQLFENLSEEHCDYTIAMKSYNILIELSPDIQMSCYTMLRAIYGSMR